MGFDAFLEIEGVKGESTDDKHKGWIEIQSFSHGMSQPISSTVSSSGGAAAGRVNMQDFSVVKFLDSASPELAKLCCTGRHVPKVTVELWRAGGEKVKYMEYLMENVMVSSVRPGGTSNGGEDLPLEEVSFNFGKMEWKYYPQDRAKGSASGHVGFKWDLQANK
ncbi:MAG: type VI secretion system tube protein Hcp [Acidobacteria bacterium]|nr:MAG: type VI secretion system tube protein Hcp [Acidobacteriota bacterium]